MVETATAMPESSSTDITRFNALRHGVLSRHTVLLSLANPKQLTGARSMMQDSRSAPAAIAPQAP